MVSYPSVGLTSAELVRNNRARASVEVLTDPLQSRWILRLGKMCCFLFPEGDSPSVHLLYRIFSTYHREHQEFTL